MTPAQHVDVNNTTATFYNLIQGYNDRIVEEKATRYHMENLTATRGLGVNEQSNLVNLLTDRDDVEISFGVEFDSTDKGIRNTFRRKLLRRSSKQLEGLSLSE
jgi:hypothetical protein